MKLTAAATRLFLICISLKLARVSLRSMRLSS